MPGTNFSTKEQELISWIFLFDMNGISQSVREKKWREQKKGFRGRKYC